MRADQLIQHYKANGHPLADAVTLGETDELIALLRVRMDASSDELDMSPFSLKRLEILLKNYYQSMTEQGRHLADDDTVQFIREIAAYIGVVRLRHANATWHGGTSLWDTAVEVSGPVKVIKGNQRYTGNLMVQLMGNQAASAWDAIVQGQTARLYTSYLALRRKISKQKLSK